MTKTKKAAQSTTVPSKWEQPQQVRDIDVAFPASVVGTLLPPMDEIPEEFHSHSHPWCRFVSKLFFSGGNLPVSRNGIDRASAARHLKCVLGSYEPKHEHKEAGAAYLMSLWYELPQ
jgi:hypothetical protein